MFRKSLALYIISSLLFSFPVVAEAQEARPEEPVVEGLIDPKPGDVFDGEFWDIECARHLDDASESIAYAKLHSLIPLGQCALVFADVCSGIHPVVTVNGCSLDQCRQLVNALCLQDKRYFEEQVRAGARKP